MKILESFGFNAEPALLDSYIDLVLNDMEQGLSLKPDEKKSGQEMIRTHKTINETNPQNRDIIVMDAGGTNFRSCLVHYTADKNPVVMEMRKTHMFATEKEFSKEQFFSSIASQIEYLKNKSTSIAFCFSYAMESLENGDAKIISLSKEIKAPEVIGSKIGESLYNELIKHNWDKNTKIFILNDTVAALNACVIAAHKNKAAIKPDSTYAAFILGTGMNAAYIEPGTNNNAEEIIVCESGKCSTLPRSVFDQEFDLQTENPHSFVAEKMCAGGYLPGLILYILKHPEIQKLLSDDENMIFSMMNKKNFSMREVDSYMNDLRNCDNLSWKIIDAVLNRSALFAAAITAACIFRANKKHAYLLCNGTTFFKSYKIKERYEAYLSQVLQKKGITYSCVQLENDITIGTSLAGI
jgi:hexokinase